MEKRKLLIWISLVIFFVGQTYAMNIESKKEVQNLTRCQQCFAKCFGPLGYKLHDQIDKSEIDEELLANDPQEEPITTKNKLTAADLLKLRTTQADTEENLNNECTSCIGCMEVFKNNVLNKYKHTSCNNPPFHYATCYDCELRCHDLYTGNTCAMCRRSSTKEVSDYLKYALNNGSKNTNKMAIYDGSAIPMLFFTTVMGGISFYLSEANKLLPQSQDINQIQENFMQLMGSMNSAYDFMGEYFGEIGEGEGKNLLPIEFSMWDLQQLGRDGYIVLALITVAFISSTRKSVSILFDIRGVIMMLITIFMGIITTVNMDVASYLVNIPLLFMVVDIFFGKAKTFVSQRFGQYVKRYPQILMMETNYMNTTEKGCKKYLNYFVNTYLYANTFGAISAAANMEVWATRGSFITTMSNWFTSGACAIGSHGMARCNPKGTTAAKILLGINVAFMMICLIGKLGYDFSQKRPIFNYKEGILLAMAAFMLNHSFVVENVFIAINFGEMVVMFVLGLCLLCMGVLFGQ